MPKTTTTIAITRDDWQRLNSRKEPGDDFADVMSRVLDRLEAAEEEGYVPDDEEGRDVDPNDFDTFDKIEERAAIESARDGREDVRVAVEELDLPGSGETLEDRRETLMDLYEHLRMNGNAQKSEFLKVLEASPHGYQDAGSAWSNLVKGKDTLHSLPGVRAPGEGEHTWRFER